MHAMKGCDIVARVVREQAIRVLVCLIVDCAATGSFRFKEPIFHGSLVSTRDLVHESFARFPCLPQIPIDSWPQFGFHPAPNHNDEEDQGRAGQGAADLGVAASGECGRSCGRWGSVGLFVTSGTMPNNPVSILHVGQ
jgi:hypothetical protein